jgi:hypothetical protein
VTGLLSRAPFLAAREGTYLFKASLSLFLFSLGLLEALGWTALYLFGNLCVVLLATTLVFAPAIPVLTVMALIVCLLILHAPNG